jgi:hypothetical protein
MDSSKIGVKVAKMVIAANGGQYEGLPVSDMSVIRQLQKKANDEGRTLAEVYKEKFDPAKVGTVTIKELHTLAAKAKSEGVTIKEVMKEALASGEPIIEEEPLVEDEPIVKEKEIVEEIDYTDGVSFREFAVEKTVLDLRAFAKEEGIPLANVRKVDIVEEIAVALMERSGSFVAAYEFFEKR